MSKRSMMRGDDAFLRAQAIKQARWAKLTDPAPKDGVANCVPVQLPTRVIGPGEPVEWPAPRKSGKVRSDTARPYFALLMGLLRPHGIPEPRCELLFDPVRKWRLDFAWPHFWLAIEIDGGLFVESAHTRGLALINQMAKQNAAVLAGWRVLRYTPQQLTKAADDVVRIMRGARIVDRPTIGPGQP